MGTGASGPTIISVRNKAAGLKGGGPHTGGSGVEGMRNMSLLNVTLRPPIFEHAGKRTGGFT